MATLAMWGSALQGEALKRSRDVLQTKFGTMDVDASMQHWQFWSLYGWEQLCQSQGM